MRSIIVLLLIMTCACSMQAQVNLIRNGGFEEETLDTCGANTFSTEYCPIKFWYQHNGATPEYFKACNISPSYGVPYNVGGYQTDAGSGSSYAGLFTFGSRELSSHEYIMTKLLEPVVIGKRYIFTMHISRNDYFVLASNIGICFEQDSIYRNDLISVYTPTSNALVYQTDTTIKDCENWVKFEYIFSPSIVGLQHLVIGNFPSFGTNIDSLALTAYCGSTIATEPYLYAYYIIDDVSLYCLDCDTTAFCNVAFPDAFTANNDGLNDSWSPIIQTDCSDDINNYLLRIFDRWGAVVYTSYNPTDAWTGANYPLGTYVYYLQYDDKSRTQVKQGSLELIR